MTSQPSGVPERTEANMTRASNSLPNWLPLLLATLGLLAFLMFTYGEFIFGDKFYIYTMAGVGGDNYRSYLPALVFFRDWLGDPSFYSLEIGAGDSVFVWIHLLLDPFNWPSFALSEAGIANGLIYAQLLRHIAVLCFSYLWLRELKYGRLPALAGALSLALTPALISPHNHFVSFFVFVSLYLYGLERWLTSRKGAVLALALAIIAMGSVYLLYKLAIFSAAYLTVRAIAERKAASVFLRDALGLLSVSICLVLLLAPLVLTMLELIADSSRTESRFVSPRFLFEWVNITPMHTSIMGVGPVAVLALPGLIVENRWRLLAATIAATLFLLFAMNVWFLSATTGFAKPEEFYVNFLYAIPVALGITHTLQHAREITSPIPGVVFLVLGALLLALNWQTGPLFYIGAGALVAGGVLLLSRSLPDHAGLAALIIVATVQAYWLHARLHEQTSNWPMLNKAALAEGGTLQTLRALSQQRRQEPGSNELNRLKKTFTLAGLNDSMLLSYNGLEMQASLLNPAYQKFSENYITTQQTFIQVSNSTPQPWLDKFMGVSQLHTHGRLAPLPGYQAKARYGELWVYDVSDSKALGIFLSRQVDAATYASLDQRQRQWQLLNAVMYEGELAGVPKLGAEDVPDLSAHQAKQIPSNWRLLDSSPAQSRYRIDIPPAEGKALRFVQLQFATTGQRFLKIFGTTPDGQQVDLISHLLAVSRDATKRPVMLRPVKELVLDVQPIAVSSILLAIAGSGHETVQNIATYAYLPPAVEEYQLPEPQVADVELSMLRPHHIRGRLRADTAGVLVLQLPWSSGWSATVDGASRELLKVNHGLMGLHFGDKGSYEVELNFKPRHWSLGLLLSPLGIVGLIAWFFFTGPGRVSTT